MLVGIYGDFKSFFNVGSKCSTYGGGGDKGDKIG